MKLTASRTQQLRTTGLRGNMQDRQSLGVPKPLNVFRAEKAVHDSV